MQETQNKPILFTQLRPSMWQYRLAQAMKQKGYKTALICLLNKFNKEQFPRAFDEIIYPDLDNLKPWIVFKKMLLHPIIFFGFFLKLITIQPKILIAEGAPHYLASFFIWFFKNKCKRIFFPYDFNYSRFKKPEKFIPKRELWGEKYAFRNCDAIFFKSAPWEFELLPEDMKKDIKNKPKFGIPSYADTQLFLKPNQKQKISYKTKEIHLVNAGTFLEDASLYRNMSEFLYFILKQSIHLHFYTHRGGIGKSEIKKITRGENNLEKQFHLHDKILSPEELAKELSKYDYGINIIFFNNNAKERAKGIAATSKIANYLEAGIPILINKHLFYFADMIKKNKIGLVIDDWNLEDLKLKIKKADYKQLVKNVLKFRENYSMEAHIDEILVFINKL